MKREIIIPILLVVLCCFIYGGSPKKAPENQEYKDIPVTVVEPSYPDYSKIEDIVKVSDRIFYGTVSQRKTAFYLNASDASTGKNLKLLYTPVNLEVINMLKGSFKNDKEAFYYEMGGSNDTETLEVRGLIPMRKDDEVVIFSRNSGTGWGNYSVYYVVKGKVTVEDSRLPDGYAANDGSGKTVFEINDFLDVISSCIK